MPGNIISNGKPLCGLYQCCRFSYPPNSLSLCGPAKASNLRHYSLTGLTDIGTAEILSQFSTLYPYLCLIAYENKISDPFDNRVVEAYWLGNSLLYKIKKSAFYNLLNEKLSLRKKLNRSDLEIISNKFRYESVPHHSFHVLNIYIRTGHFDLPHTLETMDACLVNYGKIISISKGKIRIRTQRLKQFKGKLYMEKNCIKEISKQGAHDILFQSLSVGDDVSYHWGFLTSRLTLRQRANLKYFTGVSVNLANTKNL